jgi:hypothetical protein
MRKLIQFVLVFVVGTSVSQTDAGFIVAPNSSATVDGNGNNLVPAFAGRTIRTQQVFSASEFGTLSSPELITSIAFRPDRLVDSDPSTIPSFQVNLSTTSKGPDGLSATFADNIGADDVVVFSGIWTLSSNHTGDPKDFDVVLNLQTPFLYDPSVGNLLLDMRTLESPSTDFALDGLNIIGDSVSRVIALNADPALGVNAAS